MESGLEEEKPGTGIVSGRDLDLVGGVDAHFHLDRLARRVRGQEEMRKSRPMSLASVFTVLES